MQTCSRDLCVLLWQINSIIWMAMLLFVVSPECLFSQWKITVWVTDSIEYDSKTNITILIGHKHLI